jgi:hypothetical protein
LGFLGRKFVIICNYILVTEIIPKPFSAKTLKNYRNTFFSLKNENKSIMLTSLDLEGLFQNYFRFFKKGHKKECPFFKTKLTF